MFLALREMRHAKARYSLILVIMLLLSFLVLFVGGLAQGLSYANISALENMPATHYIVQDDAEHAFRRSQLGEDALDRAKASVGDGHAAALGVQNGTVTGGGGESKADVAFFAVDMEGMLAPRVTEGEALGKAASGQVLADEGLKDSGIVLGSVLTDQASGLTFTVSGFVQDQSYSHIPVVYMNLTDWQSMSGGPGRGGEGGLRFNAVALNADAQQISGLAGGLEGSEIITQRQAIDAVPGYKSERNSLVMMIAFLFIIASFVLSVFFYVITIQKSAQFGVMKAMGTPSLYLAWSIIFQVMLLASAGLGLSLLLTYGMSMALPAGMPFRLEGGAMLLTSLLFIGMSLLGALISVARVAKADPLEAIGRAYA